jgi:hypothetical protein
MTMPEDLVTNAASEAQPGATAGVTPAGPPGYELLDEVGRGGIGAADHPGERGVTKFCTLTERTQKLIHRVGTLGNIGRFSARLIAESTANALFALWGSNQ